MRLKAEERRRASKRVGPPAWVEVPRTPRVSRLAVCAAQLTSQRTSSDKLPTEAVLLFCLINAPFDAPPLRQHYWQQANQPDQGQGPSLPLFPPGAEGRVAHTTLTLGYLGSHWPAHLVPFWWTIPTRTLWLGAPAG